MTANRERGQWTTLPTPGRRGQTHDTFMYTCIHRVYMWEVEPTLYWRVKKNGKWTWVRAKQTVGGMVVDLKPSDLEEDESE